MIQNASSEFEAKSFDPTTIIGEFSGRDSVAAILKAFEDDDVKYILPIATFAGTEYGNYDVIHDNYLHLRYRVEELYGSNKVLYPLIEHSREDIWAIMNGRPTGLLTEKYGFYSPCIGCHLYFHLTKLEFASQLSGKIISGERESHDGRVKVNQLGVTLDTYVQVIKELGCELIMPLRHMEDGSEVERLIGWDWKEGFAHPECVLSGNYRDVQGKASYKDDVLELFLSQYIKPVGQIVGEYLMSQNVDLSQLKKEVLSIL